MNWEQCALNGFWFVRSRDNRAGHYAMVWKNPGGRGVLAWRQGWSCSRPAYDPDAGKQLVQSEEPKQP